MFGIPPLVEIWIFAGLGVLVIMFLMSMLARLYRKAGPHEALVVYGFRGTRVVKGHGTIIFPMVENCRELSLELMSFDVAPQQDLYTKQGVAVTVEAVAQIKVKSDTESVLTAAEQFLTKTDQEREAGCGCGGGRGRSRYGDQAGAGSAGIGGCQGASGPGAGAG